MTDPKLAPTKFNRRQLLAAGAALPLFSIVTRRADAAEFELKYATGQDPTHPVNVRAKEALDRIRDATSGRVNIKLFPANQLGSDTDLLTQVRNGSVEFFNLSSLILSTFVPVSGMTSVGFAFKNYDDVWKAMDGDLGKHIRDEIAKTPIFTVSKIWDNGFRHVTSSSREIKTAADLKGFKVRVPAAPPLTSLFKALDAAAGDSQTDEGDDVERNDDGSILRAMVRWFRDDRTLLGTVTIEPGVLRAEVNSAERAAQIKHEIAARLGEHVAFSGAETVTADDMMTTLIDEDETTPHAASLDESSPESRAIEAEVMAKYWDTWIDEPVPALADETPRQAATSSVGRERLEALFAEYRWRAEGSPAHVRPDVDALRRKLGL